MLWPFGKRKREIEAEKEVLREDIAHAERQRTHLIRQWPYVEQLHRTLVERRAENGFGEQLEVAWRPRRRAS